MKKKRVLFISSTGGHFNELQQLQPLFPEDMWQRRTRISMLQN